MSAYSPSPRAATISSSLTFACSGASPQGRSTPANQWAVPRCRPQASNLCSTAYHRFSAYQPAGRGSSASIASHGQRASAINRPPLAERHAQQPAHAGTALTHEQTHSRGRSAGASGYSSWPRCNGYTGVTSNQSPHSSETMMRFYNQQHRFYCGIDLHARTLAVCILDAAGAIAFRGNVAASPQAVRDALAPFRADVAVACACLFAWYWLADLCQEEKVPFVLGHALYRKAIHGGKAKNDPIDAEKIARLLRGGNLPVAYVYPRPCAPPATCSAAAPFWCASGPSCSPTWPTPTPSTTCRPCPTSPP